MKPHLWTCSAPRVRPPAVIHIYSLVSWLRWLLQSIMIITIHSSRTLIIPKNLNAGYTIWKVNILPILPIMNDSTAWLSAGVINYLSRSSGFDSRFCCGILVKNYSRVCMDWAFLCFIILCSYSILGCLRGGNGTLLTTGQGRPSNCVRGLLYGK